MRYAAMVEYDGKGYCGWQRLSHAVAVQNVVEAALTHVADHTVEVVCAGRTDSGVHGLGQVIHFDSDAKRAEKAWMLGGNTHLPDDVVLHWVKPVPEEFHARFSAFSRRYRYIILNRKARPALLRHKVYWQYLPLDVERMHRAAQVLLGEHDFSSFRAAGCQANHARRELTKLSVSCEGDYIYFDVVANAFLHHMVRNLVGSLIKIGRGEQNEHWMGELLTLKDRTQAGPTAPAEGLYFVDVAYPEHFALNNQREPPRYII